MIISYPIIIPKNSTIKAKINKPSKKIKIPNNKYNTPNFIFRGQIGNNTRHNINKIRRNKYITDLFDFSILIFNE